MLSLASRLLAADQQLAPYAVKHSDGAGRGNDEPTDETRFRFQRDRDRVVHTQAFRRLKGKTQVFVGGGGDHYRTRLTHTLEVAGVSRDIARTLSLNEDLAECIALTHDIGHPPYGHAGEEAVNAWAIDHDASFEHNLQSHRIVTVIEGHSSLYTGLNLNVEVLEGLLKHYTPHDHPDQSLIAHAPSLEAQVVNLADEIAYTAHDTEDGLNAELFTLDDLKKISFAAEADQHRTERGTSMRGAIINILLEDLYSSVSESLQTHSIKTIEDVYAASEPLIHFSADTRQRLDELRSFLWNNMYQHPAVLEHSKAGQEIVRALCDHLHSHPSEKITEFMEEQECNQTQAIIDYVSGMTDSYAALKAAEITS